MTVADFIKWLEENNIPQDSSLRLVSAGYESGFSEIDEITIKPIRENPEKDSSEMDFYGDYGSCKEVEAQEHAIIMENPHTQTAMDRREN